MDASIQKALHDKLYDRRKGGALELERLVRECLAQGNHDRIAKIVDQLCHDYAYAVHQPYARNGGLIGLAAASIALGPEVARYLEKIVPPVLACFADQDARVRYYACESMYNIAKTSKGEILPFFNDVFDALAKLSADSEMSVKNGAELLDRLVKDIISDSATTYISILHTGPPAALEPTDHDDPKDAEIPTAFSLPRFIPLLQERVYVQNPFTRMFLVSWVTLLDSIPDLELVSYLPTFLGGLFYFLNDSNQDVVTATQVALERFLDEIKLVAKVKRDVDESRKIQTFDGANTSSTTHTDHETAVDVIEDPQAGDAARPNDHDSDSDDANSLDLQDEWIPGQDVYVDHSKILDILITFLRDASEEHVQLTALRWVDSFFEICPEEILPHVPRLLNQVLPALSSDIEQVRQAAGRVNSSLMDYIVSLPDEEDPIDNKQQDLADQHASRKESIATQEALRKESIAPHERRESAAVLKPLQTSGDANNAAPSSTPPRIATPQPAHEPETVAQHRSTVDYEASVNALTLQFLNENEATRIAALSWLIMLQRKAPKQVLAAHDGTFPALLKTLSDPSDTVVTRDLQLLSQISKNSDDDYFTFFMVNLLKLFCTDRRLLESRGNLIIRQLCNNLSPERIYRTMADCLEKDEDVEFASIMVQNLNNNLITAPELADMRKKLRNWESRDGQTLFVALFKAWCHNAVATISLCLLAQAYEQAYNLLQTFADIEITVDILIQVDKLVQLLESPVFTFLRLQLLEPERHPYLYKCLYGILMLLPQSAAFAALKNRLNAVSAIGYLHIPSSAKTAPATSAAPAFDRSNRLKSREDGPVKWSELLEKFRHAQDKARRQSSRFEYENEGRNGTNAASSVGGRKLLAPAELGARTARSVPADPARLPLVPGGTAPPSKPEHKSRFSASQFGKLAGKGRSKK